MKYLSDYMEKGQTDLFEKYHVFFAFSSEQYTKGHKRKYEPYMPLGAGMYCPAKRAGAFLAELDKVHKEGISQDIKENGVPGIIQRELANHEYCLTYDLTDTFEAIKEYSITKDQIKAEVPKYLEGVDYG